MTQASDQHDRVSHWENVYQAKADCETSWFQNHPSPSLELITEFTPPGGTVIDIGGGNSVLAGALAARGFDLTVLDLSATGIRRGQEHASDHTPNIKWIVGDVTRIESPGQFDLWHDRAVFHFLTDLSDQQRYHFLATASVVPGGHLVIGAFDLQGPEKCSGLLVRRYEAAMFAAAFHPTFLLVHWLTHQHITPWGKQQSFCFAVLKKLQD